MHTLAPRLGPLFTVALLLTVVVPSASAGRWYVDTTGSDSNSGLTPNDPFQHLHYAIQDVAQAGDLVVVAPGVYDVAGNGEVFPISVPTGVRVVGTGTLGNPCVVGGDANPGPGYDIRALFELGTVSGTSQYTGVTIRNLVFKGEDNPGRDSPSGIRVQADLEIQDFVIEDCAFTRGEMNDAAVEDRASILVTGEVSATTLTIRDNRITANRHGGIEILGNPEFEASLSVVTLGVIDNVIGAPLSGDCRFGIRWNGVGRSLAGNGTISGNTISGKWSSSATTAMDYGIDVNVDGADTPFGDPGTGIFNVGAIFDNRVYDCREDGIRLVSDDGPLGTNITLNQLSRNVVRGCGGSGINLRYDLVNDTDGGGYLNLQCEGNLLVGNAGYGLELGGFGSLSSGNSRFVNNTIANNDAGAVGFVDPDLPLLSEAEFKTIYYKFRNEILFFNNPQGGGTYGDQVVAADASLIPWFADQTSHCDWQGGTLINDNFSADPLFIDSANDDYHLAQSPNLSPCIDVGVHDPAVLATVDLDGAHRFQDGDFDCIGTPVEVIDVGAYEAPEPDCP